MFDGLKKLSPTNNVLEKGCLSKSSLNCFQTLTSLSPANVISCSKTCLAVFAVDKSDSYCNDLNICCRSLAYSYLFFSKF
jgi:hypothetical protein